MENSAEALKLAFAIFVFVIAMATIFMVISQAKSTADTVFYYTDKTNFQTPYGAGDNLVGVDNLIATLFRYYKESISVKILDRNNNIIAIFDTAIEKNCPWRASNENTIERIKEFITGEDSTYTIADLSENYYSDPNNYTDTLQLKPIGIGPNAGKYLSARKSLPALCVNNLQDAKFIQTFVEVTVDGKYHTPVNYGLEDDGTSIQITPGTKKVYITYQLY